MAKSDLSPGSTVELKSGGLPMTIGSVLAGKATVFFFDDEAMLRTIEIPLSALMPTDEKWGDDDEFDDEEEIDLDDEDDEEEPV